MSTQIEISDGAVWFDEDDNDNLCLFVIYASSQSVGIDGAPLQQIPKMPL